MYLKQTRHWWSCWLVLGLGAAGCTPSAPAVSANACKGVAAVSGGIGKPCTSLADCAGQEANICPRAANPAEAGFCTFACALFADCNEEFSRCVTSVAGGRYCVPKSCVKDVGTEVLPDKVNDCTVAPNGVNETGLGKPCRTAADCVGYKATICPRVMNPAAPAHCAYLCDCDDDCGAGGICYTIPIGRSCGPAICFPDKEHFPCPHDGGSDANTRDGGARSDGG